VKEPAHIERHEVISNFQAFRRDGKVIPEGMTGVQMLSAGWEPDKVLRMQWECNGHPIELVTPFGFLSRIVRSRDYLAVLEDTDATGDRASLSIYLPNGTLQTNLPGIVVFPADAKSPAHKEAGEYLWFQTPKSPLPTAFAVVFRVYHNGATYQVDIDAATGAALRTEEVH
jgi:hypothetical protein